MVIMALDHTRDFFSMDLAFDPTDLTRTYPALFLTRWITHFCAPVFVFLAGTSAFLYGAKKANIRETARFLFTRGLWLIFVELVIVNFAWTFDITYSFHILQVIWAIGVSMVVLSGLVFLPNQFILAIGLILVFGHNLLDRIGFQGSSIWNIIWYALHQPKVVFIDSMQEVNFVYPVLPWIGLMALGYVFGALYRKDVPSEQRRPWLLIVGCAATLLFIVLREFNLYGEPHSWFPQRSFVFSLMSFLNLTKYPPSLQFLLMTIGPALIFLSALEQMGNRLAKPVIVFGSVPFFFYVIHLYVIHALATLLLIYNGHDWHEYIFSAQGIASGALSDFGLGLGVVYLVWILIILLLYPICRWYQRYRESHPSNWWLSYL
jgi:uncharacterized membrane protein